MAETKVCIDLFAGLGGFSSAFDDADGWDVVTVELESKFDPDICANILDLTEFDIIERVEELVGVDFDDIDVLVVLASPPCTAFTTMANAAGEGKGHVSKDGRPNTPEGRRGILLAHYTRGLCRAIDPDYYFIENPGTGGMCNQLGDADAMVWWCQYGSKRAKPTHLWGRFPPSFEPKSCHNGNTDCHHEPAKRGSNSGTQSSDRSPAERAKIPHGLSKAILESVESPEPKQASVEAFR